MRVLQAHLNLPSRRVPAARAGFFAAALALVFAANLVAGGEADGGIAIFFAIPVALAGFAYGRRGGLAWGAAFAAFIALSDLSAGGEMSAQEYGAWIVGLLALGGSVGLAGQHLRMAASAGRERGEYALATSVDALAATSAELSLRTGELSASNRDLRGRTEELARTNAELERRTAALAASNRELEAFSYSVAHDLRAPLRAIDGFSLALLEDHGAELQPAARDYLERIRTASQRTGDLIEQLLRLSRLSRAEFERAHVDLTALVRDLADLLAPAGSRAVVEVAPDLRAQADPRLVRALLQNLLENAFKFSATAEPPHIEVGSVQLRSGVTAFYVRDNGAGFDMAHAEKLFRPFERLHRADEFPGAGVGLATVMRVARRHGGTAWAVGAPGKGATVYFTLAAATTDPEEEL